MLNRIINWVKSKFHEETPEEQDKRIHETIKNWKENVDKLELKRVDTYYEICLASARSYLASARSALWINPPTEVKAEHLTLWKDVPPLIKNKDNALTAWTKWHQAHVYLSYLYCFDITDPPDDHRYGQIKEHVDIRPAKWLKDLANEEKIIKTLQMEADANQWTVRSEDIKECEDEYKKSLNMH